MIQTEAILGLGLILLVSFANWQAAVKAALLVSVIEGALRKWILPGWQAYIYFLKDFILLGAYAGYLGSAQRTKSAVGPGVKVLLFLGLLAAVLQAFNPNLGSIANGLYGLKAYIWYVPLLWIVKDVFRDRGDLLAFMNLFLFLSVPVGILGAVQFAAPADHVLNRYVAETTSVTTFGESRAMITSTFSYIGGYTSFLLFTFSCLLRPLLTSTRASALLGNGLLTALVLGNMLMTGSRKNIVFIGICLVTLILLLAREGLLLEVGPRLLVGVGVGMTVGFLGFGTAAESLLARAEGAGDFEERVNLIPHLLQAVPDAGWGGFGTGVCLVARSESLGALGLTPPRELPPYIDFEPSIVLFELGVPGFLAWYGLRVALVLALLATVRRVEDPGFKALAAGAMTFHLAHLYLSVYLNHISNLYLWFMAGFILLLPRVDLLARASGEVVPEPVAGGPEESSAPNGLPVAP